jgi:phosphocarrier protein
MTDRQFAGENRRNTDRPRVPPRVLVRVLKIINQKGLHARASAKFVQTVEKFEADVRVSRGGETVGGTSIMGLMMLAAGPGTEITVAASGRQRAEVLLALELLVNQRFGEDD